MKFLKLPTFTTTSTYEISDNTDQLRFCPGCNYVLGNDDLCHNAACTTIVVADPVNQRQQRQIGGRR